MTGTYAPSPLRPSHRTRLLPTALLGPLLAALALVAVFALATPASAAPAAEAEPDGGVGVAADAVRGGDQLHSDGARCTVGFNATDGSDTYGLMPGYCGTAGTQWYRDAEQTVPVGVTSEAHFPGEVWSVISYTNDDLSYPSEVNGTGQPVRITGADSPTVGQSLCRTGPTTGWHCGTITAIDQTISVPEGTLTGLFAADICGEPGDDGGPAFADDRALGFLIAATGNCATGGTSYYQPVTPILEATGLTIGY